MSFYNTIEEEGRAEFKDRGSKFLAYCFSFKDPAALKKYLQKLKKEHTKAVHFCFAYRIGITGNIFRCSDDGEPAGTAGKPILGQIDSKALTDVLIVVVRYFGGTLLGVPGLINAYKSAASMALQVVPAVRKDILHYWNIQYDYNLINEVLSVLKRHNCIITSQDHSLFSSLTFAIPQKAEAEVLLMLKKLQNIVVSGL